MHPSPTDPTRQPPVPAPATPSAEEGLACCSTERQSTCCEAQDKPQCCGPTPTPGTRCGCQ
jgi:hypothetical protein